MDFSYKIAAANTSRHNVRVQFYKHLHGITNFLRKAESLMEVNHSLSPYPACAQMFPMDSRVRWNDFDEASAPHKLMMVVAIVALLHIAAYTAWLMQPPQAPVPEHEIEVTVTLDTPVAIQAQKLPQQAPTRIVPIQPPSFETPAPAPQPVEPIMRQNTVALPGEPAPVVAAAPVARPVEQAAAEIEPDYHASYLNNRLTYPLAARRMGIQGRVVLNVEVLAAGVAGQINVQQSSGHEILDKAALESVKSWRFVPARRAGQPFTKWFAVPIQFSLQDNEP